jgi:type II secretion system protein G
MVESNLMDERNFMMRKLTGFTLIELLIVVAIIAILAAIAVPNFIEAQTRSKVSRAKADMRTMVTAIEAYAVDNNDYPRDGDDFPKTDPAYNVFDPRQRLGVLTTPIAYITSMPSDPFDTLPPNLNSPNPAVQALAYFCQGNPPYCYLYNTNGNYDGSPNAEGVPQPANGGLPDNYSLTSLGPDQAFDTVVNVAIYGTELIYDPSNGTVSTGDIIMSGGNRTSLSTP